MRMIKISESGALDRLSKFASKRQAALADRLQQLLDSFSPRDISEQGQTWKAPEGMGLGTFTVEPAPTQAAGKELVYVKDESGMEVLVDPVVAISYLQNVSAGDISQENVWNLLNDASAETDTGAMSFNPQDEEAESAWGQALANRKPAKKAQSFSRGSYEKFEKLKEILGEAVLLDELYQAMSDQEATENFDHIIQMHDLGGDFGDDEELEEEDEEPEFNEDEFER